ncbi:thioesterase-like superfamily-domain-containing protein [Coprinopsis sp. MPI-PUGE-AT-0042]|nr:thioesterase-like superfamily-domain-containing protein [Coprinopsis sp. MPI-PUGE-AT-0042]
MPPFNQAVSVRLLDTDTSGSGTSLEGKPASAVYEGFIDPTWNVGNVPCGGYSLALVLEACIQHQARTSHFDPLHITSHFLRPTTPSASFTVRVQTLKTGKGFTNLTADLIQEGSLRITAHAIFGFNGPPSDGAPSFTLKPPSPYARRIPLHSHPSTVQTTPLHRIWNFTHHTQWAHDLETIEKNKPSHANRTDTSTIGGGGLEWAAWFEFTTPTEKLSNVYIPFLVDMFSNTPSLLPKEERGQKLGPSWHPTMTLAVDFKFPIRDLTAAHAQRTAGLYSSGRFVNEPQGRHDIYCEVWSAPCDIGDGSLAEGWRDKQICLATATQMALTVPLAVNMKNKKSKL